LSETKQVIILVVIVTLIGLAGLFLAGIIPDPANACGPGDCGDVYVDSYRADLYLNGTLLENFVYEIKESGKYRMLYRTWKDAPLSKEKLDTPYIEPVSISSPPGTIPYARDRNGQVYIFSNADSPYTNEISYLAEYNEAGGYREERFDAGIYGISYVFKVHPPLECDQESCHLNLKLADEHLPYKHVTITVHDPDGLITQVFAHPVMDAEKKGDTWVITGESPKDSLLEIEMLLKPAVLSVLEGFPGSVHDVRGKTLSANSKYSIMSGIFSGMYYALVAMVFLFPVLLVFIYRKYGTEKEFTVPEFLSYVPEKRKPWLVNLVFRKDPFDFDENGFYATLLDLHRQGVVKIETKGKDGLKIFLLENTRFSSLLYTVFFGEIVNLRMNKRAAGSDRRFCLPM